MLLNHQQLYLETILFGIVCGPVKADNEVN